MGSPTNEVGRFYDWEGPQTAVTIVRGFWMGKYEVTQREYLAVIGRNPSEFSANYEYAEDLSRPVEQVSWNDANNYCAKLMQQERAAGRIAANSVYRQPTEAEWEYACRAWTSTRFSYGDDPGYTNLTNCAWYDGNSGGTTHPVGQKLANPWGLYDMHGNVWEWCQDWFDDYPGGIAIDPAGASYAQGPRVPRRRLAQPRLVLPVCGPRHHRPVQLVRQHRFPGSAGPKSALSGSGQAEALQPPLWTLGYLLSRSLKQAGRQTLDANAIAVALLLLHAGPGVAERLLFRPENWAYLRHGLGI